MASISHDLRHVLPVAFRRPDSDTALLARFAASRDESAFAEIVRRHGPAVLRVCRSLLTSADADDAYQATFFVLARRADSLDDVKSLGGWLVGVAGRVARQLRKAGWRRVEVERKNKPHDPSDREHDCNLQELNDELTRLPDRFRDPLVLCYLQDRTQAEAAAVLGQSVRTLRRRLDQAKDALRLRLLRRGVPATVIIPTTPLVISSTAAARTAAAAVQFLAGGVNTPAVTLAKGLGMTSLLKLKVAAGLCAVVGALTAVGVAQDNRRPGNVSHPTKTDSRPKVGVEVPSPSSTANQPLPTPLLVSKEFGPWLVTAPNLTLVRVVASEAQYQYDSLSIQWFGQPGPPLNLPRITVDTTGKPNGRTTMIFQAGSKLPEVRMELHGPAEPMLCDLLPREIAHVVLASHVNYKVPLWAIDGLALTATSADRQATEDAAVRQFINAGKGYKLKALFDLKEFPAGKNDSAVFIAESASVVRFLLSNAPNNRLPPIASQIPYLNRLFPAQGDGPKELIRFLQLGMSENWEYAISSVYGFDSIGLLEAAWVEWLKSDKSRAGLPAVAPVEPPLVEPDPARIPPVNLGK